MIDPTSFLLLLLVVAWALREVCGLVYHKHCKSRGDRR